MCELVDGNDFPIVGEHHHLKDKRGHSLHCVHVTTFKQDIVIKWGTNNFNFDQDDFSPKFYREILVPNCCNRF
jgi:hypothetical protein